MQSSFNQVKQWATKHVSVIDKLSDEQIANRSQHVTPSLQHVVLTPEEPPDPNVEVQRANIPTSTTFNRVYRISTPNAANLKNSILGITEKPDFTAILPEAASITRTKPIALSMQSVMYVKGASQIELQYSSSRSQYGSEFQASYYLDKYALQTGDAQSAAKIAPFDVNKDVDEDLTGFANSEWAAVGGNGSARTAKAIHSACSSALENSNKFWRADDYISVSHTGQWYNTLTLDAASSQSTWLHIGDTSTTAKDWHLLILQPGTTARIDFVPGTGSVTNTDKESIRLYLVSAVSDTTRYLLLYPGRWPMVFEIDGEHYSTKTAFFSNAHKIPGDTRPYLAGNSSSYDSYKTTRIILTKTLPYKLLCCGVDGIHQNAVSKEFTALLYGHR